MVTVAAAVSSDGFGMGLIVTAFLLGLRHGIDWDHLAAITDIAGTATNPRRSLLLSTLYACGHGAVVLVLGIAAVAFGQEIPKSMDEVMSRIVGVTLLALGVYVAVGLVRRGRDFRLRSRWALVFAMVRRAGATWASTRAELDDVVEIEHVHDHDHDHDVDLDAHGTTHTGAHADPERDHAALGTHDHAHVRVPQPAGGGARGSAHSHRHAHQVSGPDDPFPATRRAGALGIGAIHGIGAETPTQVVILLGAAGASGVASGVAVLAVFISGIMISNTAIAIGATFGFLNAAKGGVGYLVASAVTAAASVLIGTMFLLGASGSLPAILGG
jgi:ABC-type nickel/cobalt efflux system permease component RcnA